MIISTELPNGIKFEGTQAGSSSQGRASDRKIRRKLKILQRSRQVIRDHYFGNWATGNPFV